MQRELNALNKQLASFRRDMNRQIMRGEDHLETLSGIRDTQTKIDLLEKKMGR
jgi:hypothetical protein